MSENSKRQFTDYLKAHKRNPKPFTWTASTEAIIEKVNRCWEVYDSLH